MSKTVHRRGMMFDATTVHVRDQLLEGEKEDLGLSEGRVEFDSHAQLITVLKRTCTIRGISYAGGEEMRRVPLRSRQTQRGTEG
jgi:hypothetical protein